MFPVAPVPSPVIEYKFTFEYGPPEYPVPIPVIDLPASPFIGPPIFSTNPFASVEFVYGETLDAETFVPDWGSDEEFQPSWRAGLQEDLQNGGETVISGTDQYVNSEPMTSEQEKEISWAEWIGDCVALCTTARIFNQRLAT